MTTRIGPLFAGPYVDGRPGAVLMVGTSGTIAHLTADQCRTLARLLDDAAKPRLTSGNGRVISDPETRLTSRDRTTTPVSRRRDG